MTAEKGKFLATDDPDVIIFRLTNGTLVHNRARVHDAARADLQQPRSADQPAQVRELPQARRAQPRMHAARTRRASGQRRRDARSSATPAAPEFHFRLAEVATMFLLPLLALALGVPPKRSTSALGVFLSIVMIVTYHKVNQYAAGDRRARAGSIRSSRCGCRSRSSPALIVLDVLHDRLRPRRAADRRARTRLLARSARRSRSRLPGAPRRRRAPHEPRISFFPSRTVALYMARMFLVRTFAVLAALVLVLQALDLLSESGNILAYAGQWRCAGLALCRRCACRRSSRASCPSRCCSARS